jgi:hypothetical protein
METFVAFALTWLVRSEVRLLGAPAAVQQTANQE